MAARETEAAYRKWPFEGLQGGRSDLGATKLHEFSAMHFASGVSKRRRKCKQAVGDRAADVGHEVWPPI